MVYHLLYAARTSDTDLEISALSPWFSFAWKQVLNQWFFLKQIENKQPVQTSFRCVYRERAVFLELFQSSLECHQTFVRRRCVCNCAFFISSRELKTSKLGSSKNQGRTTRKQASETLLFPSVRWSKSWNLRETAEGTQPSKPLGQRPGRRP